MPRTFFGIVAAMYRRRAGSFRATQSPIQSPLRMRPARPTTPWSPETLVRGEHAPQATIAAATYPSPRESVGSMCACACGRDARWRRSSTALSNGKKNGNSDAFGHPGLRNQRNRSGPLLGRLRRRCDIRRVTLSLQQANLLLKPRDALVQLLDALRTVSRTLFEIVDIALDAECTFPLL